MKFNVQYVSKIILAFILALFLVVLGVALVFGTEDITLEYLKDISHKIAGIIALVFAYKVIMIVVSSLKKRL